MMILKIDKTEFEKDLHLYFHSIFITPQWIESVSSESSIPIYLDIFDNGKKIGKISGLIENSKFGKQLYCYASPALIDLTEKNYTQCLNNLVPYAKSNNLSRIIIGSYDNKHSLKYIENKYYTTERVEYVVPLHKDIAEINQNKRFKRNVKKANKIKAIIHQSNNKNYINIFLSLLKSTLQIRTKKYKKSYTPYYLKNLNQNTLKKLINNQLGNIYYTKVNDSYNCMEFNLEVNNYVYMLLKGTDEFGYKNGLSSFISSKLMEKYSNKGILYYNQGGRPIGIDGNGLTSFKKSMGAEEITTYGATTNFLIWPYKILNPILIVGRRIPQSNFIIKALKKLLNQ